VRAGREPRALGNAATDAATDTRAPASIRPDRSGRVKRCVFGYEVNLDWPDGSEWGYAPFGG
jgi:hypothetical protein